MKIFKKNLRDSIIYKYVWKTYHNYQKSVQYKSEAIRLTNSLRYSSGIEDSIRLSHASRLFRSTQNIGEIKGLLSLLSNLKVKNMLEIGTSRGGTLFLFCQLCNENAKIISMDYKYINKDHKKSMKYFARKGQRLFFIESDSHEDTSVRKVKNILGKDPLDFLFIDGDHTFEGVKMDYEKYSPLVKLGGIIAFHDIAPDQLQRTGQKSKSYTGGVPFFWESLKISGIRTQEFIDDPYQDGFGIGVVIKI